MTIEEDFELLRKAIPWHPDGTPETDAHTRIRDDWKRWKRAFDDREEKIHGVEEVLGLLAGYVGLTLREEVERLQRKAKHFEEEYESEREENLVRLGTIAGLQERIRAVLASTSEQWIHDTLNEEAEDGS